MAPRYRGEHLLVACSKCQQTVAIDSNSEIDRCPICEEEAKVTGPQPGDSLVVLRRPFSISAPNRWDVVVIRSPVDSRSLLIKRLLGRPGEEVHFAEGDLWINNQRIVKSLAEQLATRLPSEPGQTTDDLAWNADLSRPLNSVNDQMVEFRSDHDWQITIKGLFVLAYSEAGLLEVRDQANRLLWSCDSPPLASRRWLISIFDSALLIAADRQVFYQEPFRLSESAENEGRRIQVLSRQGEIRELTFWRDIYYEAPQQRWQLGADQWFVVGDNQAISVDSRNWTASAGVPSRLFVGSVLGRGSADRHPGL